MINGVLVERTVNDVLPALQTNADGLKEVLENLVKQYRSKQEEMEKWKVSPSGSVLCKQLCQAANYMTEEEQCPGCSTVDASFIDCTTGKHSPIFTCYTNRTLPKRHLLNVTDPGYTIGKGPHFVRRLTSFGICRVRESAVQRQWCDVPLRFETRELPSPARWSGCTQLLRVRAPWIGHSRMRLSRRTMLATLKT